MDPQAEDLLLPASTGVGALGLPPRGPHSSHLLPLEEIRRSMKAEQSLSVPVVSSQPVLAPGDPSNGQNDVPQNKEDSSRTAFASTMLEAEIIVPQPGAELPILKVAPPRAFLPPHLAEQLKEVAVATASDDQLATAILRRKNRTASGSGKLRRRVSSLLKVAGINILEDDQDHVKGLWDVFDVDGDGIIDYAEFSRYTCDLIELQKKKKTQSSMTSIEAKFVRIVILEIMQLGTLQKAIESVFHMLDLNRSGKISQLEFEDGIRALGIMHFNYEVHGKKRRFADTSLFVLPVGNPLRYWAVWLVEWKWFDRFILTSIILNSAMLAFRDYQDPGSVPDANGATNLCLRNKILDQVEVIFSWIFVGECGLKIVAMGFLFGRGAYLRNYWNMLDFFVVVIGLIGDLPGVPKVSSLRTARMLRPLRTLSNLRRMRMLVYALLSALPALFNVMVILAFVFTVFGILGVLFWNGALFSRCRETPAPVNGIWKLAGKGRLCGGAYICPESQYCGSVYAPPEGSFVDLSKVSSAEKWDYALVGFDNIGQAMLTLFQCITLEGWTTVMYNMQDAHSYAFATVYFVTFTVIGAFFLLQFVFAVIWERFNAANDGTAGEWDLILEERRASAVSSVASGQPQKAQDPDASNPHGLIRQQSSIRKSIRSSFHSGMIIVKRKNPTQKLRLMCNNLVTNSRFSNFIVLCILLNTATLALDEYPVDSAREHTMEIINTGLTMIFSAEMILKLVGLGWKGYRSDRLNVFDGCIVIVSMVEFFMKVFMTTKTATGLSALRSFRLFRIMKLARSWRSLRELLQTIGNSLADVANFGLLLLLLMYVFALIGMQFFANKFRFDESGDPVEWQPHVYNKTTPPHAPWTPDRPYAISRSNFDDSIAAFTTVFQCLTEENWVSVMYDGVRSSGWSAAAYFLLVMVVGNIIILNLFLAILLGNFSVDDLNEDTERKVQRGERQIEQAVIQHAGKANAILPFEVRNSAAQVHAGGEPLKEVPREKRRRRRRNHSANSVGSTGRNSTGRNSTGRNSTGRESADVPSEGQDSEVPDGENEMGQAIQPSSTRDVGLDGDAALARNSDARHTSGNPRQVRLSSVDPREFKPVVKFNALELNDLVAVGDRDSSLLLFRKRNIIRRMCNTVIHHRTFESLMLVFILFSSAQLAIDNPLNDPASRLSITIVTFDKVFTLVFLAEMVLKVIDSGFLLNGKNSYLRDPWNILDFCILIFSSFTLFSSNKTLRSLRSLRTLRALRPLRMISRVPGMRRVVNALLSSIPCIMNVFLVCTLIFLIFGIVGVNLFKGRMFHCDMSSFSDGLLATLEAEFGFTALSFRKLFSKDDCVRYGGVWTQNRRHYDNVLKSAMTLFEMSTTEGWVGIMFEGVDATEIGYHPVENYNRAYIIFFIVFIIIGSFFTMNLFVGAVIDNFNRMRDSMGHLDAESETQREWLQIQEAIRTTRLIPKPKEPKQKLRKLCYRLQQHRKFEALIAASVLGNTIMLAITHFQQSSAVSDVLSAGNIFFWFVFLVEAAIKLMSLGHTYFFDRWNLFDFAVVCGSTVSTILPFFTEGKISPVANTLRAFRMGLAIRLMKRAKSMQDIVNTILDNMPALVNVSTLMFLIIFVYAVIGVQLYAGVMLGDNLDEHANFQGIVVAIVTLFRFATGEAWNDVMYDMMVQPIEGALGFPYGTSCVSEYTYTQLAEARNYTGNPSLTIGCSPGIAVTYLYFLTYQLITSYVLLNLFVAVILEGFEETAEKNSSTVTKADLRQVCLVWEKYDPFATGYLSDHVFLKFLRDVPPPLGLPRPVHRKDVALWAKHLDLIVDSIGRIGFNTFILSATYCVMKRVAEERGEEIVPARSVESFFTKSQLLAKVAKRRNSTTSTVCSLLTVISVKRIQAAARSRMARKRFLDLRKQLAAQRLSLYDKAAMSNFKNQAVGTELDKPLSRDGDEVPPRTRTMHQQPRDHDDLVANGLPAFDGGDEVPGAVVADSTDDPQSSDAARETSDTVTTSTAHS